MEQFQESANIAKQIIHELYNDISKNDNSEFIEILEVLKKVFIRLENLGQKDDVSPLINRLTNYLYFTAYTKRLTLTKKQENLIRKLCDIGKYAGVNGIYRGNYGDISQF